MTTTTSPQTGTAKPFPPAPGSVLCDRAATCRVRDECYHAKPHQHVEMCRHPAKGWNCKTQCLATDAPNAKVSASGVNNQQP